MTSRARTLAASVLLFGLGLALGCDKEDDEERSACVEAREHVSGCLDEEVELLTCDEGSAGAILDLQCDQIQQAVAGGKGDSTFCEMFGLACEE